MCVVKVPSHAGFDFFLGEMRRACREFNRTTGVQDLNGSVQEPVSRFLQEWNNYWVF